MSDKCVCHINGYAVKDATARSSIKENSEEILELHKFVTQSLNDIIKLNGKINQIQEQNVALINKLVAIENTQPRSYREYSLELVTGSTEDLLHNIASGLTEEQYRKLKELRILFRANVTNPNGNVDVFQEWITFPITLVEDKYSTLGYHSIVSSYHAVTTIQTLLRANFALRTLEFKFRIRFGDYKEVPGSSLSDCNIRKIQLVMY